jgi:hypothetical protein
MQQSAAAAQPQRRQPLDALRKDAELQQIIIATTMAGEYHAMLAKVLPTMPSSAPGYFSWAWRSTYLGIQVDKRGWKSDPDKGQPYVFGPTADGTTMGIALFGGEICGGSILTNRRGAATERLITVNEPWAAQLNFDHLINEWKAPDTVNIIIVLKRCAKQRVTIYAAVPTSMKDITYRSVNGTSRQIKSQITYNDLLAIETVDMSTYSPAAFNSALPESQPIVISLPSSPGASEKRTGTE